MLIACNDQISRKSCPGWHQYRKRGKHAISSQPKGLVILLYSENEHGVACKSKGYMMGVKKEARRRH
jgi:hypothetical protein